MRLYRRLALLVLIAAPVSAQSKTDARDVTVAAAKNVVAENENVTKVNLLDTTYARSVAAAVPAAELEARKPPRPFQAWLYKPVIRGDSAFVFVTQHTTYKEGPFTMGYRLTLVRRSGTWAVTHTEFGGIS